MTDAELYYVECKINNAIFDGKYSRDTDGTIILGIDDKGYTDKDLVDIKSGLCKYMKDAGMFFTRAKDEEGNPMIIVHIPKGSCD